MLGQVWNVRSFAWKNVKQVNSAHGFSTLPRNSFLAKRRNISPMLRSQRPDDLVVGGLLAAERSVCRGKRTIVSAAATGMIEPDREQGRTINGIREDRSSRDKHGKNNNVESSTLPLVKADEKKVHIGWDPLNWSRFHNFWLRDHCRCPNCFHQITKQRLMNTFDISPDIRPSQVEATESGLKIIWNGFSAPHVSFYPWTWLKLHSHEKVPSSHEENVLSHSPEKVLWGAKIVQEPPTLDHDYVMNEDKGLWKLLKKIDTFGFCFISGVDVTPEATEELTLRIGRIRQTQYGSFWDFTSNLAKGDTAYTTLALGAHTDTTYFTDPCGLQLFHLLEHTDGHGGETLLVDGFYAASILKELHPDAYETLATVRVPTHAAGEPGELFRPTPTSGYPILNLDPRSGKLIQVRYNNDDRSAMKGMSVEEIDKWYSALRLWNEILKSPDSEYWVQLSPGTAVIVDNHRVLHGRSAFDGKRRMCGAYIGMDDFRSKLTVLSEKFAEESESGNSRSNWSPFF